MKLVSRQRQHVFSQQIKFQLNLTKIEKMPDTVKKECLIIQHRTLKNAK